MSEPVKPADPSPMVDQPGFSTSRSVSSPFMLGLLLAHNNLAYALVGLGRREEAVQHLKEALRLKPDYENARQQLRELGVEPNPPVESKSVPVSHPQ